MAKRLFVGGLPYTATDDELKQFFAVIGDVTSATVITDRNSGQGKGFGFVEYADDKDADKAIKELSGKELGGRKIIVNESRPVRKEVQLVMTEVVVEKDRQDAGNFS